MFCGNCGAIVAGWPTVTTRSEREVKRGWNGVIGVWSGVGYRVGEESGERRGERVAYIVHAQQAAPLITISTFSLFLNSANIS